jgi:hypothetical protein
MKKRLITGILAAVFITGCEKVVDDSGILKFYGDAREDIGYSIVESKGDFIIAGLFTDLTRTGNYIEFESSNRNMGILKVDSDGNQKWKLSVGGKMSDEGAGIIALEDGSSVCAGFTTDTTITGEIHTDIFIAKVSINGNLIWENKIGGNGNQKGSDILQCSDGGFLIVGYTDIYRAQVGSFTENIAGKKDIFIIKTDASGVLQWSAAYGFGGDDYGVKIKEDKNGNYIILGTTGTSDPGQDKNNMILIKINSLGGVLSSKIVGSTDDEYAADIVVLNDGYLVAGTIGNDTDNQQILAIRLTNNIFGAPMFTTKYQAKSETGEILSSKANAVTSPDGNRFILAGQAIVNSSADMLVIGLDENGIESGTPVIKGGTGIQSAFDVITDSEDNIIAVGKSSNKNNSMISFWKFRF